MEREIGVGMNRLVGERWKRARAGLQVHGMATGASHVKELVASLHYCVVDWAAVRRGQKSHEIREGIDVIEYGFLHFSSEVENAVGRRPVRTVHRLLPRCVVYEGR